MITVKTFQARREKLAAFLLALPKESFSIDTWTWPDEGTPKQPACGTAVCAIGWCPTVFPRHWMLMKECRIPQLRSILPPPDTDFFGLPTDLTEPGGLYRHAAIFFGMTRGVAHETFMPNDGSIFSPPKRRTVKQVVKALLKAEVTSG